MKHLTIVETADGSKTVFNAKVGEHYHSNNGALQESLHVFVNAGLKYSLEINPSDKISICEVGFGTGLNFLLSAEHCTKEGITLNYTGIEAFPLESDFNGQTGYDRYVSSEVWEFYQKKYIESFEKPQQLNAYCSLKIEP
ncbi:MAG: tRNA (5-methylaminomethyl-2-thiouridylate)-methyltransferase, partial [Daejeonella sp.]|nr:tRNA (5-methylaminomethyl-2-thiouridylate)-methyltransferase [Daejeonella sp.]